MTLPSFSRSQRVFGQALAVTLRADELKALNGAVFRVPGVIRDSDAEGLAAHVARRRHIVNALLGVPLLRAVAYDPEVEPIIPP